MNRATLPATIVLALLAVGTARADSPPAGGAAGLGTAAPEVVSQIAARLIAEAIPHQYERTKDWGRTKQITSGLRSSGNFFDFDVRRRRREVNHGVWKHYRVTLIEPEHNLEVRIENLRSIGPGRFALTLFVTAKLHGWGRAKVYERGIHVVALELEGDTTARLWLDAEIAIERVPSKSLLPGVAIRPVVTDARLALEEFRLRRISSVRGALARELSSGLRRVVEDELAGPKLVARLNRAIDKRRDRLKLTPEMLLRTSAPEQTAEGAASSP